MKGTAMTPRERAGAAFEHRTPDRVPVDGWFRPEVWEKLYADFGTRDYRAICDELGLCFEWVGMNASHEWRAKAQQTPAGLCLVHPDGSFEDEWGVRQRQGANSPYLQYVSHPLANESALDAYDFPDLDAPGRWEGIQARCDALKSRFAVYGGVPSFFLACWTLRGFEDFLCDLSWNPTLVERLVGRFLERHLEIVRRLAQTGVDYIALTGDISMQTGLFMSLDLWRKYFKAADARLVEEAHAHGVKHLFFHSDGNLGPPSPIWWTLASISSTPSSRNAWTPRK